MLTLVLAAVTGCTAADRDAPEPPSPTPSPVATAPPITGPRVAIVLPVAEAEQTPTVSPNGAAIERLRGAYADGLSEVRAVTPDGPDFIADVVALMAERGYELVCVVGSETVDIVLDTAVDYPRTRFCGFPSTAVPEAPDNVLLIDLAVEEPATLAAAVALELAPESPPSFVGARSEYALERRRTAFQDTVEDPDPDDDLAVSPLIGVPADDEERAASFARTHIGAGAAVLYTEAGPADAAVLPVAADLEAAVIGSVETLFAASPEGEAQEPPEEVLFGIEERLDAALRVAVDRLLGDWSAEPVTVGFADGAYALVLGGHPRSAEAVRFAEERLGDGVAG